MRVDGVCVCVCDLQCRTYCFDFLILLFTIMIQQEFTSLLRIYLLTNRTCMSCRVGLILVFPHHRLHFTQLSPDDPNPHELHNFAGRMRSAPSPTNSTIVLFDPNHTSYQMWEFRM